MPGEKLRNRFLSNPQAIFFDTSILVGFFNKNKTEEKIADLALQFADRFPHASRHIVTPCLVELFFKTQKVISPKDIRKNLSLLHIELYPTNEKREIELYEKYCESTYKNEYDFADFYMCSVSLDFNIVEILTLDKDDIALAMSRAYSVSTRKSNFHIRHFP
jgi:predicted nucleic acid-binding protein